MAQSRHGISGDLRIPKNPPYQRARHIQWNKLNNVDADGEKDGGDNVAETVCDVDPKQSVESADEPKVWEF